MLAVGARSKAVLKAVQGDLDGAIESAEEAMLQHDQLPMPFERARTQLLLGQLQRRRRRTRAAYDNLGEAARIFNEIGSPLWAARAERELERLSTRSAGAELTDSEWRVAELAASGLSNNRSRPICIGGQDGGDVSVQHLPEAGHPLADSIGRPVALRRSGRRSGANTRRLIRYYYGDRPAHRAGRRRR